MAVEVIVFDAYGTLFDVYGVERACEAAYPGKGKEISITWRQKQLEYTWLRSLMQRYTDFDQVTRDALIYTLEKIGLHYSEHQVDTLLALYTQLPVYPEVKQVLHALSQKRLAILSNGTAKSLSKIVEHNQLSAQFAAILSADPLQVYKPVPLVYQMVLDRFHTEKDNVLFVSSNGWDVAGAKSFGFQVAWINRSDMPQEQLNAAADCVVQDLQGLVEFAELI